MTNDLEIQLDSAACTFHNLGASLKSNRQENDLEWLAHTLFTNSRLGAGDIKTVPWLIGVDQWEYLGLEPEAILGDGPRNWDMLTDSQKEAWRSLARICLYVLPQFASRVGARYMDTSVALRQVWKEQRRSDRNG
jgi:hypothetical protein